MSGGILTGLVSVLATFALIYGARRFALFIANLTERQRPVPPSDDVFGDLPNLPRFVFHKPENDA